MPGDSTDGIARLDISHALFAEFDILILGAAAIIKYLSEAQATEITKDLSKLVDDPVIPKPNKKWYSTRSDGLIRPPKIWTISAPRSFHDPRGCRPC